MHLLATLAALTPLLLPTAARASGRGTTTRYWDCCKPSCAWPGKASLSQGPLLTCDINDNPLSDGGHTESSCDGGGAFTCSSHSPWAVDDYLSYGWAAVKIGGQRESDWCCACYELRFTDGPLSGKKMVVQATDTGDSLADNHFDIAMPGGGVGYFNGCSRQWGAPSDGWGERYGGVITRDECWGLPSALRDGCFWRFDWFGGVDNPDVSFREVECPAELVRKSGCKRS